MLLQFDFLQIIGDVTPIELRTTEHIEWLNTLIKPLCVLDNNVRNKYDEVVYDQQHVGQVLSLEHYLNEYFSLPFPVVIPNSIYITDGEWLNEVYAFIKGVDSDSDLNHYGTVNPVDPTDGQLYAFNIYESPDPVTDVVYLYNKEEYDTDQVDFYINVESGWYNSDASFKNKIDEIVHLYKKIGKKYKIIQY